MTNEKIAAMAAWTLEDFQEDPLAAIEQVRALATAHLSLQRERDAAVRELRDMCVTYGDTCNRCAHKRNEGIECYFPDEQEDADDRICRMCDSECLCGHCDGESKWEWRGPQPEQVLAPADTGAMAPTDNPVLAPAT